MGRKFVLKANVKMSHIALSTMVDIGLTVIILLSLTHCIGKERLNRKHSDDKNVHLNLQKV